MDPERPLWKRRADYGSKLHNSGKVPYEWISLVQDWIPELLVLLTIAVLMSKVSTEICISRNNLVVYVSCIPVLILKYEIPYGKTRSR
jgi:hypothetical protein